MLYIKLHKVNVTILTDSMGKRVERVRKIPSTAVLKIYYNSLFTIQKGNPVCKFFFEDSANLFTHFASLYAESSSFATLSG